mmetsp:Transcript_5993/g.14866  ORF Transcript_5993/g.14866 Transcript_5993/m.14866 type:complete len:647 (-) Transcript_5993:157-2097(-)
MTFLRGTVCTNVMNGSSSSCNSRRRLFHSSIHQSSVLIRSYSSTPVSWFADDSGEGGEDEQAAAAAAAKEAQERKHLLRQSALAYNQQKAAYKRQVGKLRHQYKVEHARHQAQDLAERDAAVAVTTRRRLERQRAKNERSFQNAIRQEELRRQNAAAFADHLKQQQEIRTAQQKIHQRARQLLIDELEEESKLWLTSKEEVEAAFDDPRTEQMLWARPQGILGVPNPSLDSHFWTYEGHTWDRSKTYKTKSQILLQQLEEEAYVHTNVDFDHFWTEDKLAEAEAKEDKAKLRANVRMAGRRALLQRQKDYLSSEQETAEGEPPKPPPIPSLGVLGNVAAQEKEGTEILLKDPTKFFVFADGSGQNDEETSENETYSGSSLGVPVAVRDPLRTGQPQGRVFPIPVGKLPKPDLRSEKEKKRQEREERLWAAAAGKSASGDGNDEDMLLAEEDREIGEAIDYEEANANWDSDDEDWNKGLDEDRDKELLNLPREFRYRHEDLDQVIERLEAKAATYQSHVQNTIRTMEQEARSRLDRTEEGSSGEANGDADETSPFFDASTAAQLRSVGADVEKYERLMASLTHEQLLSLFALEANASSTERDPDDDGSSTEAARTQVFEGIPGLSQDQIAELTELESFIRVAETEQS